jgi:hypothetical protein
VLAVTVGAAGAEIGIAVKLAVQDVLAFNEKVKGLVVNPLQALSPVQLLNE